MTRILFEGELIQAPKRRLVNEPPRKEVYVLSEVELDMKIVRIEFAPALDRSETY